MLNVFTTKCLALIAIYNSKTGGAVAPPVETSMWQFIMCISRQSAAEGAGKPVGSSADAAIINVGVQTSARR